MSCAMACVKDFFEAEPLIPDRLNGLVHSRLVTRLTRVILFFVSSIQPAYSLRYMLFPMLPLFVLL